MIVGIGVDIVDLLRFEQALSRTPSLRGRLFTPGERELPDRSLAARFAAKEAFIKAMGGSDGVFWQEMEILRSERRTPELAISGSTAERAAAAGVTKVHVSLAHDGPIAVAYVVVEAQK